MQASALNITHLRQRPVRALDPGAISSAVNESWATMLTDPGLAVRSLLQHAIQLCAAPSAGLGLLREDEHTGHIHWHAVSGSMADSEGRDVPRNFSPCGMCLDADEVMLVAQPHLLFPYLAAEHASITEILIIPLRDVPHATLGTLWLAHHEDGKHFCSTDVRIMEQLGSQIAIALKLLRTASAHRQVEAQLQSLLLAQTFTTADLAEERQRREAAEAALHVADEALTAGRAALKEAHHRVKNSLQMAGSVLALQARATESEVVRFACNEAHRRLKLLAKVHELLEVDSKGSPALFMPSLLLAVSDALQQSFAEQTQGVTLHAFSDPLWLLPNIAVPIALVVNEALTNIYKHAFGETGGTITVELRAAGDGGMTLRITDNGRGFQPGDRKDGLGLGLIRGLALQLRGTVKFATPVETTGTVIELCVPPSTGIHVQVEEFTNARMRADTDTTIPTVRATEFRLAQSNGS